MADNDSSQHVTRRRIVKGLGAGSLVGLAGCTGSGTSTNGGSSSGSGTSNGANSGAVAINLFPTSGSAAQGGKNIKAGSQLRYQELEESGNLEGTPLETVFKNSQCSADTATSITKNAVSQYNNPFAYVGGYCSPETLATMPLTRENELLQIVTSFSPKVTNQDHPFVFRVAPNSSITVPPMLEHAIEEENAERHAVIGVNNSWGKGEIQSWRDRAKEKGKKVVSYQETPMSSTDYSNQLTLLKSKNPDAIYFAGYSNHCNNFIQQASDMGIDFSETAVYTAAEAKLASLDLSASEVAEGTYTYCYFVSPVFENYPESAPEPMVNFINKWNDANETSPIREHASGYALAQTLVEAVKRTGTTDVPKLAEMLHTTEDPINTPLGAVTFKENGQGNLPMGVAEYTGPDSLKVVKSPW